MTTRLVCRDPRKGRIEESFPETITLRKGEEFLLIKRRDSEFFEGAYRVLGGGISAELDEEGNRFKAVYSVEYIGPTLDITSVAMKTHPDLIGA